MNVVAEVFYNMYMGMVKPFYFQTRANGVWHKAVIVNKDRKLVIAGCGQQAMWTGRFYRDTETRPYAGGVCKRCEGEPVRANSTPPKKEPRIPLSFYSPRGHEVLSSNDEPDEVDMDESNSGGMPWELAMAKRPRRILP